jgi:hypothetical protein
MTHRAAPVPSACECEQLGADSFHLPHRPVVSRIIRDAMQLARASQLINEAVVGMAIARQQEKRPRDNA